jgi:hypothetical protein
VNTDRLTTVSTFRDAPPEVVAEFRAVDPRAELLYLGRGKWWVGLVYTNIPLIQDGRRELIALGQDVDAFGVNRTAWPSLRTAMLKSQGFRKVHLWDIDKDGNWIRYERFAGDPPWGYLLNMFARQDWIYRHHPNSDASWHRLLLRHELGHTDLQLKSIVDRCYDAVQQNRKGIISKLRGAKVFGWRPKLAHNQR